MDFSKEINDRYVCEYGQLHDYSSFNLEDYEKELANTKTYTNLSELWAGLDSECEDDEVLN